MKVIRPSEKRGHGEHGWLDSYHTFSFADYHDPRYMGFRHLRVLNEDRVQARKGFGLHPHRDMEIITYVISGELEHRDSMGNAEVLRAGEVQAITAGEGIFHSEMNCSKRHPVHFLQIWIVPQAKQLPPRYGQKSFERSAAERGWQVLVSPDGREGSLSIAQDVVLYRTFLDGANSLDLAADRHGWLQVIEGELEVNGTSLKTGDGLAISKEEALDFSGKGHLLFFDLT